MIPVLVHHLDREYAHDVAVMREEFAAIDRGDPASLGTWFSRHPYLRPNDHAAIAGVCLRTVRRWQDAAGLPRVPRQPPPGWRRPRPAPVPSPGSPSGAWLRDQYAAGHSIRALARAVNRSYTATRRQLRRLGAVFRLAREAVRSRHPCCNRSWLFQNYVALGRSLSWCAGQAGVSKSTLTAWLLLFGIRVRANGEQQALNHATRGGSGGA